MYNIRNLTLEEYLEKIAEPSFPGPASGSVCATAAAMASAVVEMSCKASIKKDPQNQLLIDVTEKMKRLKAHCLRLADDDMKAFGEVIKGTKKKKEFPNQYEDLLQKATDPLVAILEGCEQILVEIQKIHKESYAKVLGDLAGAVYLSEGAAIAVKKAIEVNLTYLSDMAYTERVKETVETLYENCSKIKNSVINGMFK
ncbi:formiminotetrahydrofolate cyclodeaminase [Alkalibaculum bacchi]|uniref:Formiminotetrahydrofolate cyclodeaminase n=1 Tax=Alkalibaculum bacchi TaxID=645887 RepID=A0A366ICP7_9FIRM|nr:cyclodeaminase/cyclohydrolase family protein [Alkalibaculum bacchi]RBP66678.1 formiminotetrahydrofolate cyclodeaminase [Alkalibaculum bacchi]